MLWEDQSYEHCTMHIGFTALLPCQTLMLIMCLTHYHVGCLQAHARAATALGAPDLARALSMLSADAVSELADLLLIIAPPFARAFFPRQAASCAAALWQ